MAEHETFDNPEFDAALCKCGAAASPWHLCPLKVELTGDETLCNCCEECTEQCGYDI